MSGRLTIGATCDRLAEFRLERLTEQLLFELGSHKVDRRADL